MGAVKMLAGRSRPTTARQSCHRQPVQPAGSTPGNEVSHVCVRKGAPTSEIHARMDWLVGDAVGVLELCNCMVTCPIRYA